MKRHSRKSSLKQFEGDLHVNEDGSHWLNDAEFKRKYQVSRMMLDRIMTAIEHNEVLLKVQEVQNKSLSNTNTK
jgi:hypothetical protein